MFKGNFTRTTANLSPDADIKCDFEKPLLIESAQYDGALLVNVLEHIFEYRQLLNETHRILKPRGRVIILVPFMFPYHPSPGDFHRYTASALERALATSGFRDIRVTALGSGVCAARWLFIERLLPRPLRFLSILAVPMTASFDSLFTRLARLIGKKYQPSDYAIGFRATAIA